MDVLNTYTYAMFSFIWLDWCAAEGSEHEALQNNEFEINMEKTYSIELHISISLNLYVHKQS